MLMHTNLEMLRRPGFVQLQSFCLHTTDRFQRGDGRIQEHQFYSVGRWWSGQDQASMEALLPKHARLVSFMLADLFTFGPEICGHIDMLALAVWSLLIKSILGVIYGSNVLQK